MDSAKVQVFHTLQRCVRRAFLCGEDEVSAFGDSHQIKRKARFLEPPSAVPKMGSSTNNLCLVSPSRRRLGRMHPESLRPTTVKVSTLQVLDVDPAENLPADNPLACSNLLTFRSGFFRKVVCYRYFDYIGLTEKLLLLTVLEF